MPPKQRNILLDPRLQKELAEVLKLVQKTSETDRAPGPGVALVRPLSGVTLEEWKRFSSSRALESWLAIPLEGTHLEAVSSLLALQEQLAFQRDHDALTGIGNRGLFNRVMAVELDRAVRLHSELSLVLIDLDNFKQVNDTYGHGCGDRVLQGLSDLLRSSVRRYDTLSRIGGEEFAIILPSTPGWTAATLAKRILARFRNINFFCPEGRPFSVSFSAGVSCMTALEAPPTPTVLLQKADEALYTAKRQGKNQVVLSPGSHLDPNCDTLVRSQEKRFLFSHNGSE